VKGTEPSLTWKKVCGCGIIWFYLVHYNNNITTTLSLVTTARTTASQNLNCLGPQNSEGKKTTLYQAIKVY